MTATIVLDGQGLQALARRRPPASLVTLLEVWLRRGPVRLVVPSAVLVEALTGTARDAPVLRELAGVEVEDVLTIRTARAAAALRQGRRGSAVDAIVAESALRRGAVAVVTSDPQDLGALVEGADPPVVVINA